MNDGTLKIGYIPLTDALPLIAAQELGIFSEHGLDVVLQPEVSWSNIRDKLNIGLFDAAHMLAPMLFATRLGLSGVKNPLITAFSFGLNGNAITISNELFHAMQQSTAARNGLDDSKALAEVITKRAARGMPPLTFATVFPYSCHWYQLHQWIAQAGTEMQQHMKLCILPPEQMVAYLQNRLIDGFCVGEPWNSAAVANGIGHIIATGVDIWPDAPEKVLAISEGRAKAQPAQHSALIQALYQAAEWVEYHRHEAAEMLSRANIVQVAPEVLCKSLADGVKTGLGQTLVPASRMHVFHRNGANIPQQQHALFLLRQMQLNGQWFPEGNAPSLAQECFRTDLYHASIDAMAGNHVSAS